MAAPTLSTPGLSPRIAVHQHAPAAQSVAESRAPRQPVFWAALAFASGIGIGRCVWRPPFWWLYAALVLLVAAAYWHSRRPRIGRAAALIAFVAAGAFSSGMPRGDDAPVWLGEGDVTVTAHVTAEGNLEEDGPDTVRQRVDVETELVQSDTRTEGERIGIRLSIYARRQGARAKGGQGEGESAAAAAQRDAEGKGAEPVLAADSSMPLFRYGQRIRFPATLNPPRNFRNPGAFDYAAYLREQRIVALASTKYSATELLPGFAGNRASLWLAKIHRSVISKVHVLWPEEIAGLIDAMLIGEKAFVDRPTKVDFQRSGTYHMLVVAGLHVGILSTFLLWTFSRIGFGTIASSAVTLAAIFGYAMLTREGTPVWRAALMLSIYVVAKFIYRNRSLLNALGVAGLLLLVIRPDVLLAASYQMSMLCVILLAGVGVPLLERTIEPFARGARNLDAIAYDRSLPLRVAQFRLDLRMILGRLQRRIPRSLLLPLSVGGMHCAFAFARLLVISAAMQAGMALPMAYYFHRATSLSIPANVLAVPLLQVMMPAATLAVGLSYLSQSLAHLPAVVAGFTLRCIAGSVRWLGGLSAADVRIVTPGLFSIVVSLIAIFLCVCLVRRSRWLCLGSVGLLFSSTLCIWQVPRSEQKQHGVLEMTAIDVGQGDSLLLVFPEGRKVLLDGGGLPEWMHSSMDMGEDVVSPYLWARGIARLDAIALTHAHADHAGGLKAVIANFRPRELWLPRGLQDEEIRDLLEVASRYSVRVQYREAPEEFQYSGTTIRVLAPDPAFPVRVAHRNDESLVLKITFGVTRALLEADAEKGTERVITAEHPETDVLKVAHHGSASATNADFLAVAHPRFAVISVGARNVYHHPRSQVLERLQQAGAITYRTDLNGATTFLLDGRRVTSQTPDLR